MKGNFWRKALAAALALLIVSGGVPIQPVSQLFERTAITAEAAQTTLTYTFKKDSNIYSYIVYNNTERKLSNDYYWDTGTAQFDDMTITITGRGVNVDTMRTNYQNETGYTYCVPMKATYTFSSTSKYITHVKIYAISGDKEIILQLEKVRFPMTDRSS